MLVCACEHALHALFGRSDHRQAIGPGFLEKKFEFIHHRSTSWRQPPVLSRGTWTMGSATMLRLLLYGTLPRIVRGFRRCHALAPHQVVGSRE